MTEFSFNLVDEPWIPCINNDGVYRTLGIRDLLLQAHEIKSIQHQNPLTEAALLRVLLAVIHRAVDGPRNSREWKELYQAGKFDDRITQYLEKWRHRFDLFSKEAPFYQTPGLLVLDHKSGRARPKSIACVMLGHANGHNKTLFNHTIDEMETSVSPTKAAQVLITAQMFSLMGTNNATTNFFGKQSNYLSSPMVSGIFIALAGKNLFETLILNLLIYNDNEPLPSTDEDCPVWERKDRGGTTATTPRGYLDFLTCKCRHILLVPECDGERILVEHIHLAQGEAFPDVSNPAFFKKKKKDSTWYHPQLDVDRLVWRDSSSLFSFDSAIDERPKAFRQVQSLRNVVELPSRYVCTAYAIANDKANPLAWRKEKLNVPLSLLSDGNVVAYLEKGMSLSDKSAGILADAVKVFMREYLPKKSKDVAEKAKATGIVRMYWDNMEGHFHQFLLDLDNPEKAIEKWGEAVKRTAYDALDSRIGGRYRGSARSYRAWSAASAYLNKSLAIFNETAMTFGHKEG